MSSSSLDSALTVCVCVCVVGGGGEGGVTNDIIISFNNYLFSDK